MSIAHSSRSRRRASSPYTLLGMISIIVALGCSNPDLPQSGNGGGTGGSGGSGGGGGGGGSFSSSFSVTPGAASLPPNVGTSFCDTDDMSGIAESGRIGLNIESGDVIPLCSGWVFIADKTNERVVLQNIVSGDVDTIYDLPGSPDDLELDLDNKRLYATLPGENLLASIDLVGTDTLIAAVNTTPTSVTQTPTDVLVAADAGTELRSYAKSDLRHLGNSDELMGGLIVFNNEDSQLISVSASRITLYSYTLDTVTPANTLTELNDDPATGDALDLVISPNFERAAFVSEDGNASFVGTNVVNDYQTANMDSTFGAWKVDASPTAAAFSPLVPAGDTVNGDSDYLIATSAAEMVIFDTGRHAEISRSVPGSSCAGNFDTAGFSRGGEIAIGKMSCTTFADGTEIHWVAPTAGFGNSDSTIGVDTLALGAILPAAELDPLCSVDDVNAITTRSSGSLVVSDAEDMVALCDGYLFVSERATNRVKLINVITDETVSEWDLPDLASDMVLDEANKFLFASMPGGAGLARIDLAGPNMGDLDTVPVPGFPTSLTLGTGNFVWAATHFEPGVVRLSAVNGLTMTAIASKGTEVEFSSFTSEIAYDRTNDLMFLSDEEGFARFELNGAVNSGSSFVLPDANDEVFDNLNSEIVVASPDLMSIALVDQTAGLVYDFDDGDIANHTGTFWQVDSLLDIAAIAFDGLGNTFGVATTNELMIFDALGTHAETHNFMPAGCGADEAARVAISRGAGLGFYKSNCGVVSPTQTIFWYEL